MKSYHIYSLLIASSISLTISSMDTEFVPKKPRAKLLEVIDFYKNLGRPRKAKTAKNVRFEPSSIKPETVESKLPPIKPLYQESTTDYYAANYKQEKTYHRKKTLEEVEESCLSDSEDEEVEDTRESEDEAIESFMEVEPMEIESPQETMPTNTYSKIKKPTNARQNPYKREIAIQKKTRSFRKNDLHRSRPSKMIFF